MKIENIPRAVKDQLHHILHQDRKCKVFFCACGTWYVLLHIVLMHIYFIYGNHRSKVWNYFTEVENKPNTVECKACNHSIKRSNNTSNLWSHLQINHPQIWRALNPESSESASNSEYSEEISTVKKPLKKSLTINEMFSNVKSLARK